MDSQKEDFFKASVPLPLPQNVPYKACQILHIPLSGLNIQQDLIRGSGTRRPVAPKSKAVDTERLDFCTIRKPRLGVMRSSSVKSSKPLKTIFHYQ